MHAKKRQKPRTVYQVGGDGLQRGQLKHVEADVVAKDRVDLVERSRVPEAQPRDPLRPCGQPGQKSGDNRQRDDGGAEVRADREKALTARVPKGGAVQTSGEGEGEAQVGVEQRRGGQTDDDGETDLRPENGGEHLLVADRAEPPKVEVELRGWGHADQDGEHRGEGEHSGKAPCPRSPRAKRRSRRRKGRSHTVGYHVAPPPTTRPDAWPRPADRLRHDLRRGVLPYAGSPGWRNWHTQAT